MPQNFMAIFRILWMWNRFHWASWSQQELGRSPHGLNRYKSGVRLNYNLREALSPNSIMLERRFTSSCPPVQPRIQLPTHDREQFISKQSLAHGYLSGACVGYDDLLF